MSSHYYISRAFHEKYANMYDHLVIVTLKNGNIVEGAFTDEFYEDEAILISPADNNICIIQIADIEKMELSPND